MEKRISTAGVARRNNRYFVALRNPGTSIGESWEFPGGKNRAGESVEQTLKREYLEEFNAVITVGKTLYEGTFENRGKEYLLVACMIEIITAEDEFVCKEHQKSAWMSLEELMGIPMADSDRQILKQLLTLFS